MPPERLHGIFGIQQFVRHKSQLGEGEHSNYKNRGGLQGPSNSKL
jgi:hypothetical protein